jgi:four helix bundle protein
MNNKIRTFEDLVVWQRAIAFVKHVYLITEEGGLKRDFGLKDQLRRAAVSIPTNIAEGFERSSRKEYLLFLNIAKGSAGEVRSLCRVTAHYPLPITPSPLGLRAPRAASKNKAQGL